MSILIFKNPKVLIAQHLYYYYYFEEKMLNYGAIIKVEIEDGHEAR